MAKKVKKKTAPRVARRTEPVSEWTTEDYLDDCWCCADGATSHVTEVSVYLEKVVPYLGHVEEYSEPIVKLLRHHLHEALEELRKISAKTEPYFNDRAERWKRRERGGAA